MHSVGCLTPFPCVRPPRRSSSVSGFGSSSGHGVILPVPASSARGARVLLSRSGACFVGIIGVGVGVDMVEVLAI